MGVLVGELPEQSKIYGRSCTQLGLQFPACKSSGPGRRQGQILQIPQSYPDRGWTRQGEEDPLCFGCSTPLEVLGALYYECVTLGDRAPCWQSEAGGRGVLGDKGKLMGVEREGSGTQEETNRQTGRQGDGALSSIPRPVQFSVTQSPVLPLSAAARSL